MPKMRASGNGWPQWMALTLLQSTVHATQERKDVSGRFFQECSFLSSFLRKIPLRRQPLLFSYSKDAMTCPHA